MLICKDNTSPSKTTERFGFNCECELSEFSGPTGILRMPSGEVAYVRLKKNISELFGLTCTLMESSMRSHTQRNSKTREREYLCNYLSYENESSLWNNDMDLPMLTTTEKKF